MKVDVSVLRRHKQLLKKLLNGEPVSDAEIVRARDELDEQLAFAFSQEEVDA